MKWIPVITIFLNMLIKIVWSCPSDVCICKWKGGKQTVECGGQSLLKIPEGMDPGTQVLNFTGNNLQVIQSERFSKMELINLQKIYLSRNQIHRIHDKAFKGLSNLVELDLSENILTTIPTETFHDYPSLMRLSLSGNPIRELKTSAFRHLSFITTLELSNCQIEKIEDEAFMGLVNLEWLRLEGNKITTIVGKHILPESLHGINLQGNRWQCDCLLFDMHAWLLTNHVPHTEEPKCVGPNRLAGQTIKSVSPDDLACLPDITPTTLYLEIAEGRNISLLCKISAIPAATISWWFDGQILQNDSMLTPQLHLYYFLEEGFEEKRSELFIQNTKNGHNGTFACVAENPAGRTQANYTIRVIVKEEPIVEEVSFPFEYFLIIVAAGGCMGLLFLIVCCILICKCRRKNKRRNKNENGKDNGLQFQNNQIKCASITTDDQISGPKLNGSLTIAERNPQDIMLYVTNSTANVNLNQTPPIVSSGQYCSPPTRRTFQDQNPDLINDAESVNKTRFRNDLDCDGTERGSSGPSSIQESIHGGSESNYEQKQPGPSILRNGPGRYSTMSTLPRGMTREMYQHQADVHLNPGCFLGHDGYPIDYGLPKVQIVPQIIPQSNTPVNFYRTLPHNRGHKIQTAANPNVRFSREAEFLTRSQPYEAYGPSEIRYTAEGYAMNLAPLPGCNEGEPNYPSPPEGYKGNPKTIVPNRSCCTSPINQPWPTYLPGYHPQVIPIKTNTHEINRYSPQPGLSANITKRCVSAQTSDPDKNTIPELQNEDEEQENDEPEEQPKTRHLSGPLADSPDEGYVGDSQDGSDM